MLDTILEVTAEGEFLWHQNADKLIDSGDFRLSPSMPHILRRLRERDRLAAENAELLTALIKEHGMYKGHASEGIGCSVCDLIALKKGEGK